VTDGHFVGYTFDQQNKIYGSEKGQWVPPATTTSKREVIETYRRDDKDTGSPEVQISSPTCTNGLPSAIKRSSGDSDSAGSEAARARMTQGQPWVFS
jgi:hypothetical protein